MEKKILLLFLYIGVLVFIKNQELIKIQENRGFYIDNIDLGKEEFLEATLCLEEQDFIDQKKTTS